MKANTVGGGGKYYTSFLVNRYWMIVRPVLIRASVIVTTICDCWESKVLQGTPWIPGNLTVKTLKEDLELIKPNYQVMANLVTQVKGSQKGQPQPGKGKGSNHTMDKPFLWKTKSKALGT